MRIPSLWYPNGASCVAKGLLKPYRPFSHTCQSSNAILQFFFPVQYVLFCGVKRQGLPTWKKQRTVNQEDCWHITYEDFRRLRSKLFGMFRVSTHSRDSQLLVGRDVNKCMSPTEGQQVWTKHQMQSYHTVSIVRSPKHRQF